LETNKEEHANFHGGNSTSNATILVAEDIEVNRTIVSAMLEQLNIGYKMVVNGEQAVAEVANNEYHLVFMDCQMPGMDGYEATRRIRSMESDGSKRNIPIVALTAGTGSKDQARCYDAGMNGFISKPFTTGELESEIQKWIDIPRNQNRSESACNEDHLRKSTENSVNWPTWEQLKNLNDASDGELIGKILSNFEAQFTDHMNALERNLTSGKVGDGRKSAHALKSMSANVGAKALAERFKTAEESLARGEQFDCDHLKQSVHVEYEVFLKTAKSFFSM
jgi:CheY-like chemotaxis protein/HPt (histidine-containing phosphotransfer) domain-containing protein